MVKLSHTPPPQRPTCTDRTHDYSMDGAYNYNYMPTLWLTADISDRRANRIQLLHKHFRMWQAANRI